MSIKALSANKTKGLVIDRPGYVMAVPYLDNGKLDWDNAIRNVATILSVTVTNTRTKTDILDGNSFYKAGDRVTAIAGTLAIEFQTVDPRYWALVSGTGKLVEKTGDTMLKLFEPVTIDEETGKVELEYERATVSGQPGKIIVTGDDGTEFTEATGGSAEANQYKVESSEGKTTLTFNAEDKGKVVVISEEIKINTASYTVGRKPMPAHRFIIDTTVSDVDNTYQIPANFIISRASIGSDTTDALQKDPSASKTLTFDIYAPRAGEEPYQVKFANMSE